MMQSTISPSELLKLKGLLQDGREVVWYNCGPWKRMRAKVLEMDRNECQVRLGIQRYYSGRQNQVQIERVIRVPRYPGVTNQDVATTEDGTTYRIDLVQSVDDVFPACMDLTLAKYEQAPEGSGA